MSNNARLQNLYDFTVQVRNATDDRVVGTGMVVALDGQIVTSGRVVRAAGVDLLQPVAQGPVIFFPQVRAGEISMYQTTIATVLPQGDEELVLLQLSNHPAPLAPEQIAVLGTVQQSEGHPFRSYAYHASAEYGAYVVEGIVKSPPVLHLTTPEANRLLSGAAVLDTQRNLVIGIISTVYASEADTIMAKMLVFDAVLLPNVPFQLSVHQDPLPLRPAPQPRVNIEESRKMAALVTGESLNGALPPPANWVERAEYLQALNANWADPHCRIMGLIGSPGTGKTSLARSWLDKLQQDRTQFQPDGIFWWSFHLKPNIGAFFESALSHLGGRLIDVQQYPSSSLRMQLIAAMLRAGHYLFILDGLEVWQQSDNYGRLRSRNLREFLRFFASPDHPSYCLITSRMPVTDILDYPTYRQQEVAGLSIDEGRNLLLRLGLREDEWVLDQIVVDLEGHPFTLSLIGAYLGVDNDQAIEHLEALVATDGSSPLTWQSVLHRRLGLINALEHRFLTLLSAFRLPVDEMAFARVMRGKPGFRDRLRGKKPIALTWPLASLSDTDFAALLASLVRCQLIRYDPQMRQYSLHPLLHEHFASYLPEPPGTSGSADEAREFHLRLKDYYLAITGETPRFVTMSDLEGLIEAVHHACCAGRYEDAFIIYWERIEQGELRVFAHQLGAHESLLELMGNFFPGDGNLVQYPQVIDLRTRHVILDTVGFCLLSMGRVREAAAVHATKNGLFEATGDWFNASIGYRNLALLYLRLGDLSTSYESAQAALDMAGRLENRQHEVAALAQIAWVSHLRGDWELAGQLFQQAEALQQEVRPEHPSLYSQDRVWYANHLCQTGQSDAARRMTEHNLSQCEEHGWVRSISQCRRILGDLSARSGQQDLAGQHYHEAVAVARNSADEPTLIEALLARGHWFALQSDTPELAFTDLQEALDYALASDYRIYEAQIRLALAQAHRAVGNTATAQAEEQCARRLAAAVDLLLI